MPMRTLARLLLAAVLLTGLSACPPRAVVIDGRTMTVDEASRYELERARAAFSAGDHTRAAELFENVARRYPDAVEADEALFGAGQAWEAARQPMRARAAYERLLQRYPHSDKTRQVEERIAALGGGRDAAIAREAQAYEALPEREKFAAAERLATQAEQAGNGVEAFHWREQALLRAPDAGARTRAEGEMRRLLDGLSSLDVERLRVEARSPAAPLVAWRMAQLHQERRDWDRLVDALADFTHRYPHHPLSAEARTLLQQIERRGQVAPTKVGVILPLSGQFKAFGDQIRAGIEHGMAGSRVQLVFRDTRGEADGATAAVERLLYEDHVIAIVGGVITAEAQAAAAAADAYGVPYVSFSRSEGFAAQSEWVFRDMLTNGAIADALVAFAMDARGMRRFAVLHPEIAYGEEMRDLFWERVEKRGGEFRGVESYAQETTTFSEPIRNLVQKQNVVNRAEYQRKLRELREANITDARKRRAALNRIKAGVSPVVEFDALFIPDQWKTVALVAPALAFEDVITNWCDTRDIERIEKTTGHKVQPVMLLGGNLWNHRDLPARAGKYINCSVFVDGFHAGSSRPETVRFVESFTARAGRAPGLLEAYGSEAATVVRTVIEQQRPENRRAFREGMLSLQGVPGPMGPISVTEEGEVLHPLYLLTVDRGAIREANPAGGPGSAL